MAGVADTTTTSDNAPAKVRKRAVMSAIKRISPEKARKILSDGTIRGKPITASQKRLFGMVIGMSEGKK